MSTTTANYGFILPTPNSPIDANTWGTLLNSGTFTPIDTYLKTTALSNISNTAPTIPTGAPLAGQAWIDTNSSSTTAWYTKLYDGAQWVTTGTINPTTHTFTAAGVGSGSAVNIVTFTSTGTYTPSSGMTKCVIECWGAGGGGGGTSTAVQPAGGGGSGGYSQTLSTAADIGTSKTVTVGAFGTAGNANGGNGGTTSVGSLCIANGGSGCVGGFIAFGAGAVTTSAVGNVLIIGGQAGDVGYYPLFQATNNYFVQGGRGGSTNIGAGGVAPFSSSATSPIAKNGNSGQGYGSGGSGGTVGFGGGTANGGTGASGFVRITEYFG